MPSSLRSINMVLFSYGLTHWPLSPSAKSTYTNARARRKTPPASRSKSIPPPGSLASPVLLPADAGYGDLPSGVSGTFDGVVCPHHGGRSNSTSVPGRLACITHDSHIRTVLGIHTTTRCPPHTRRTMQRRGRTGACPADLRRGKCATPKTGTQAGSATSDSIGVQNRQLRRFHVAAPANWVSSSIEVAIHTNAKSVAIHHITTDYVPSRCLDYRGA
jgi:hypothetical protein